MNGVHLTSSIQVQVGQKSSNENDSFLGSETASEFKKLSSVKDSQAEQDSEFLCCHSFETQIQFHKFKWPLRA